MGYVIRNVNVTLLRMSRSVARDDYYNFVRIKRNSLTKGRVQSLMTIVLKLSEMNIIGETYLHVVLTKWSAILRKLSL